MRDRYIFHYILTLILVTFYSESFSQKILSIDRNIHQSSSIWTKENTKKALTAKSSRKELSNLNKSNLKFVRRNSNLRSSSDTLFFADFPSYTAVDSTAYMGTIDGDSLYGYTSGLRAGFEMYYEVNNDTNHFLMATSWFTSPGQADNYFIVDSVNIPSHGAILKWEHKIMDNDWRDGYDVYVSVDSGTTLNMIKSFSDGDPSTDGDTIWTEHIAILDSNTYGGKTAKIIFHHNAYDQYNLALDNILLLDGNDTSQFISYASTCGSIFYQGFPSLNGISSGFFTLNNYDADYVSGIINMDIDSANFNYWITTDFSNAEFSNNYSGAFLDSLLNDGDIRLMFSSWMEFPTDTANDIYGFVVNIPENGAILNYRHRFMDPEYRNGYSIKIQDTLAGSFPTTLISFDDNDSLTSGDSLWRDISITIDSNIWGNKSAYLYIHHQSVDQYIVEFDDIHLIGNCPIFECNSYTQLTSVYKDACGNYNEVPFPMLGNDTVYFETDTIFSDSAIINGTCYTQTLYLNIFDAPDSLSIIGTPNTLQYDVEYYSVMQNTGSTYDWAVIGGNILSGQGTNSIQVQWSTLGQGYVQVLETSYDGCEGDTNELAVMVSPLVGFNEAEDARFMIYPNPAKDDISIVMNGACTGGQLFMYNMLGEVIFEITNIKSNKLIIPHSDLSQGTYLMVFQKENTIKRKRFIIE